MAKGWIVLGFAAGYVAGSAAGRKQYERIKSAATELWNRPEVQRTVKKADSSTPGGGTGPFTTGGTGTTIPGSTS